tara:strand:- start:558 stop:1043 length:486 start_codon:yes stop_codon:yes gene_type:complete
MRKLVKGVGFKMTSPFKEIDNQTQTSEDVKPMSESEKKLMHATNSNDKYAVDLGTIEPTERGRSLAEFKNEVENEANEGMLNDEMFDNVDYFNKYPTEESDEMADKIIAAKNKTLTSSMEDLNAEGYRSRGDHFVKVEKPLQKELKEKIKLAKEKGMYYDK